MNIIEIEEFLKKIKSILSCKIIVDTRDQIEEVHILADSRRGPKQLSRDIQSAFVSKFGIEINHKKISIAQIDEKAIEDSDFRLILKTVELSVTGLIANVKVVLEKEGEIFSGEAKGPKSIMNTQRLLSAATLNAIETFLGVSGHFVTEEVETTTLAGKDVVVSAVTFLTNHTEQLFTGCAVVEKDGKEAVVKATLDAINRRVMKML